jgi:hypothetical protein
MNSLQYWSHRALSNRDILSQISKASWICFFDPLAFPFSILSFFNTRPVWREHLKKEWAKIGKKKRWTTGRAFGMKTFMPYQKISSCENRSCYGLILRLGL